MMYTALEPIEQSKVGHRILGKKTIIINNKCHGVVPAIWPNRKDTKQPEWFKETSWTI